MNNFKIIDITREDGQILVQYAFTKSFNGGTDEKGEERGIIERDFEANTVFVDNGESDEYIETVLKKDLRII